MHRSRATALLVPLLFVLDAIGAGSATAPSSGRAGSTAARAISLDERVAAQRAIDEVYWRHRIWPKENPRPKPAFSSVVSDRNLRGKVDDYLRKSNALEQWWQRPVTSEQLQAELDRMSAQTRDPRMLRELYAALGNEPLLIAETLARQTLVERLIRSWYAGDRRFAARTGGRERGSFDEWWSAARALTSADVELGTGAFSITSSIGEACADDTWQSRFHAPLAMSLHAAVWTGAEMIVWGTAIDEYPSFIEQGGRYDPATDTWRPISAPSAPLFEWRSYAAAVWTGTEMIVWGGLGSTGARYEPTSDTWTPTSTGDNVPSARQFHTAVWTGSEMIVWGGRESDGTELNTGARYDPATDRWVPTSTFYLNLPEGRSNHTAVWTGTEMIVWGGSSGRATLNTGGRYDPITDTWLRTSQSAIHSPSRSFHTAVWTGTEMIVWGGSESNTGARYDPADDSWRPTSNGENVPSGRRSHTAVWTGTEMIVWGGYDGAQSTWLGTGGRYDPPADTWLPTAQGASAPEGRSGNTAVWTGLEMIVWGGQTNAYDIMNTGGRYDPAIDSWVPTASALRSTGSGDRPTAVWTGTEMIVWGGLARDGVGEGDRYRPSTDAWLPVSTGPNAPLERQTHTAVWTGEEMIVWGGWQQSGFGLDGGGRYDPSTDTWAAVSTGPGTPAGRGQHTAVWTGTEMIVWGGETEFDYVNEVFVVTNTGGRYDPSSDSWSPTSTSASVPEARFQHAAVWTGTEMVVWGGSFVREPGQGRLLHSGGRYDPAGDSWNATSENGSTPEGRTGHTALWTGTEMIVWGGDGSELGAPRLFDDGARYDPSTDSWLSVPADPSQPGGRAFHTALWTGDEMLVWGGYGDFNSVDSGSRYAPTTDQWNPTSTLPPPRIGHAAVWTGSGMIVAGGYPPDPYTYFYCVCSDADRDDVCAGEDPFPESDSRATVVIGECDSGVPNEFVSPGANMNDLIAQCRADAPVPGEFVSCVALLTNAWKTDGRITGRAKSRMQRCVGPS